MPDYSYQVRVTVDVSYLPRGTAGTLIQQRQANLGGYGPNQTAGSGPAAQSMRFIQAEVVPNVITTPPTQANIITALTSAANNVGQQIPPGVLSQIVGWATGGE